MKKAKKNSTASKNSGRNPTTPNAYLARLSAEKRAALQSLRANIKAAAPDLEECISYGIPGFRLNGKFFIGYGAAANHCAFYPGSVVQKLSKGELKNYEVSKGTIRFSPVKPLPKSLVRELVKLRLAQQVAR
jgi:uncharacterized protein YdhG (YjbR/CyaY superfamily)